VLSPQSFHDATFTIFYDQKLGGIGLMKSKQNIADVFNEAIADLLLGRVSESDIQDLAKQLADSSVRVEVTSPKELVTVKKVKGQVPTVVHYNPLAVVRAAAHAFEAIVELSSAETAVLAGAAALACGAALREIRHRVPPAESILFYVLCNSDDELSRERALNLFAEYCVQYPDIKLEDFAPALQGLFKSGFVSEERDVLSLVEPVYRTNLAPMFDV
jgi:hypothetical protein